MSEHAGLCSTPIRHLYRATYGASQNSVAVVSSGRHHMEFTVRALAMFLLLGSATADEPNPETSPSPSPTPAPAIGPQMIESALPEGTPQEQAPTILLPEPNFLPPPPPQTAGTETALTMASGESKRTPQDESRFKEIKDAAMGSARANHLMKEAKGALSGEARKNFLRAYYYTICAQMRRLDPNLKPLIQAYESEEIQKIASEGGHSGKAKSGRAHGGLVSRGATAKKRHHPYREY